MAWTDQTGVINESLAAVWGLNSSDLWAAGVDSMYHWDGASWTAFPVGCSPQAIFGFATDDVWAVGIDGTNAGDKIVHWDGAAWSVSLNDAAEFLSVWGVASNDVWACGFGGAMWHWDGATWSSVASGTAQDLWAIWGIANNDAWAVGANGTTIHWDGATWSVVANGLGLTSIFRSVSGTATNDVLLVGENGVIAHWNGAAWALDAQNFFTQDLHSVFALAPDDVWIAGDFEFWLHLDSGGATPPHPVSEDNGYSASWLGSAGGGGHGTGLIAFATNDAWAVGTQIQAYHWDGPNGGGGGGEAPVVTLISPTDLAELAAAQTVVVEVTCTAELKRAILIAQMTSHGITEVIHDGDGFGQLYRDATNARTPIVNGYRFAFVRQGGWPEGATLTLKVIAYDTLGNEV